MEIYFPKMDGKVFCKTIAQQSQHSNHFRPTSDGGDSTGFPIVFTPYSASSSSAAEAMTINRAGAGSCPLLNPINPLTPPTHPKLFKMFCGFNFRWLQFVSGSSCFFFFLVFLAVRLTKVCNKIALTISEGEKRKIRGENVGRKLK